MATIPALTPTQNRRCSTMPIPPMTWSPTSASLSDGIGRPRAKEQCRGSALSTLMESCAPASGYSHWETGLGSTRYPLTLAIEEKGWPAACCTLPTNGAGGMDAGRLPSLPMLVATQNGSTVASASRRERSITSWRPSRFEANSFLGLIAGVAALMPSPGVPPVTASGPLRARI